jgi:hypothetical protein
MSTLATMKTRIADELMRSDLTSQIALAIPEAIAFHQKQRFYFNERNDVTFSTVAAQAAYTSSDEPYMPVAYDVDDVFVTVSGNEYRVKRMDPSRWRILNNASTQGQPHQYSYFNRTMYLYPIPDQAYTMRMVGHFKIDAPASDAEANNPWMVEAEALIRHTAKMILYRDVIFDDEMEARCSRAAEQELVVQRALTSSMIRGGMIEPMAF